jgi:hypothetical protein
MRMSSLSVPARSWVLLAIPLTPGSYAREKGQAGFCKRRNDRSLARSRVPDGQTDIDMVIFPY